MLAWRGDGPLAFAQLQRRLNRRRVGAALRAEVPVVFMAYDVLEIRGEDWRGRPQGERRAELERLVAQAIGASGERGTEGRGVEWVQPDLFLQGDAVRGPVLRLSGVLPAESWRDVAA